MNLRKVIPALVMGLLVAGAARAGEPDGAAYLDQLRAGQKAFEQGKLEAAESHLQKALELEPGAARAMVALARVYIDTGELQKAYGLARRAVATNPGYADAFLVLGTTCQMMGKDRQAVVAYGRYLKLAPDGEHAADVRAILSASAPEAGNDRRETPSELGLTATITRQGITISGRGGVMPPKDAGPGSPDEGPTLPLLPACNPSQAPGDVPKVDCYDYRGLTDLMVKIKDAFRSEDSITLAASPEVPYAVLVRVMDAVREHEGQVLFPNVILAPQPPSPPGGNPRP